MTRYNPLPLPENAVTFGRARFILLTPRMVRLEWAEDGIFEDRATLAVVHRAMPAMRFTKQVKGKTLSLSTDGFTLTYTDDGEPFSAENLTVAFTMQDSPVTWRPGLTDTGNLGATIRTLDGVKGGKSLVYKKNARGELKPTNTWAPVDLGRGFVSHSG